MQMKAGSVRSSVSGSTRKSGRSDTSSDTPGSLSGTPTGSPRGSPKSTAYRRSTRSTSGAKKKPGKFEKPQQRGHKLPSSFTSSYRIHEILMQDLDLPTSVTAQAARWILCFLVIQFDVDIGPDLKIIRPSIKFTEDDFRTICFSSLPERSHQTETPANASYVTCCSKCINKTTPTDQVIESAEFHTFRFNSYTHGNHEIYGYSLFSQQKSLSISRGYRQESLVILSTHNFPRLFEKCLYRVLKHDNFLDCPIDHKIPCIDNAIYNIASWPNPEPNTTLEVGFLGTIFNVVIPSNEHTPLVGYASNNSHLSNSHQSGSEEALDKKEISSSESAGSWNTLIQYFGDISELYLLYELVLLGRPIIIYSPTPKLCSMLIANLIELIRPVPYAGRIREYITIHSCPEAFESMGITGVTNPLLIRSNMDAYVFLLNPKAAKKQKKETASSAECECQKVEKTLNEPSGGLLKMKASWSRLIRSEEQDEMKAEFDRLRQDIKVTNRQIASSRYLVPDAKFVASLSSMVNSPYQSEDIDYAIKFHFATLTSKLIAPLSMYLVPSAAIDNEGDDTLTPPTTNSSPTFNDTASTSTATTTTTASGLVFNQLDFVNDLANDDEWNTPIKPSANTIERAGPDSPVDGNGFSIWHTLQKMSSKASLLSPQNMGIRFSSGGAVSKQEFYHEVIQSSNFKAWLRTNGATRE
ncbi:hypothetical protein TRVA0_019S01002 [Trichomonascus vanleenenianus]|uniref:uncharacterized protein n=1 Tax=Trichomonascus vanleenenianus TaxID=2268995 RepID=UPI003ECA003E